MMQYLSLALHFENVSHPWALPMVEAKFIVIQTFITHEAYQWECSYAYSSIVGGFLQLQVAIIFLPSLRISIISLPTSRREIHVYKLPSTYITNFL
jgi:hypothetical protein